MFSSVKILTAHVRKIHPVTPQRRFACELCSKTYSRNYELKNHIETFHNGKRPHVCKKCPKSYVAARDLKLHFDSVHKGIRFTCNICGATVSSKASLTFHIKSIHYGLGSEKCANCDKSFQSRGKLKLHMSRVHATCEKVFKCDICSKTFAEKNYLTNHRICHNLIKPYKCPHCPKSFHRNYSRKIHLRVHEPIVRSFKCEICDKYFSSLCGRKGHYQRVHVLTRKKNFCVFCDKGFHEKSTLFAHIRSHTQERTLQMPNLLNTVLCHFSKI